MSVFTLPDLGEGLEEAEIVAWMVGEGDHVVADQPLVSVETEKAVVEVPAPQSGRIAKLHGEPGDTVKVGAPLVEFEDVPGADTGTVVGTLEKELGPAPEAKTAKPAAKLTGALMAQGRARAAPAVRKRAAELGVDLSSVAGTGPGGSITRADVERAAAEQAGGAAGARVEPVTGVRKAMAQAMTRAGAEVVPATVTELADVEGWTAETDATALLIEAVAAACRAEPSLNAWYDAGAGVRRLFETVDLGIAMDTPDGLFVPVLRDAGTLDRAAVRARIDELEAMVKARSVPLADLRGATITLSNFGTLGGRHAALVIVPPQVAIIGAGRAKKAVVAVDGAPAVRSLLPLSLTFDHRVVTGGEAARFLAALVAALEASAAQQDNQ